MWSFPDDVKVEVVYDTSDWDQFSIWMWIVMLSAGWLGLGYGFGINSRYLLGIFILLLVVTLLMPLEFNIEWTRRVDV